MAGGGGEAGRGTRGACARSDEESARSERQARLAFADCPGAALTRVSALGLREARVGSLSSDPSKISFSAKDDLVTTFS